MDIVKTTYGSCRCCLLKGNHKDIMKEYSINGAREVYINIFMECFNLYLSTSKEISSLICSSCIQRLRDANTFRMMVVNTERQLVNAVFDKETIFVNVPVEDLQTDDVKIEEQVKVEPDDQLVDYDSDYIPYEHYESADVRRTPEETDLVDGEAEVIARFPPGYRLPNRKSLYSICEGYVNQLDLLKGKMVIPKMIAKLLETERDRLSRKRIYITEKMALILNASTILENSNVTPFKSKNRSGFPCFYCRNIFENLEKLREHQEKNHKRGEIRRILSTYGAECLVVYIDTTDMKCLMCDQNISSLPDLKNHLIKIHKKKMHTDYTDRVIPFKLSQSNVYECQVCGFNFETFGSIERHMNVHYRNYVCNQCGTGFVTKYRLKVHIKSMHVGGNYPCEICKKVYTTQQKHKNHVDTVHKMVKRFKCPKCLERFSEYFRRQKHLVEIHGVAPLQYKCNVCDKSFDRRYTLSRHMKRDHLDEKDYQCQMCSYKCFTNNELRVHMVKHNGERIYECSVCKKSYARKKTLREHMRIHNNDRRFACAVCGQAFVQKCSLKGHIKTHHVEYNLPPNF